MTVEYYHVARHAKTMCIPAISKLCPSVGMPMTSNAYHSVELSKHTVILYPTASQTTAHDVNLRCYADAKLVCKIIYLLR